MIWSQKIKLWENLLGGGLWIDKFYIIDFGLTDSIIEIFYEIISEKIRIFPEKFEKQNLEK